MKELRLLVMVMDYRGSERIYCFFFLRGFVIIRHKLIFRNKGKVRSKKEDRGLGGRGDRRLLVFEVPHFIISHCT